MPCISWLALMAVCAVLWTPVRPDWIAAPELLAACGLIARLLGGRAGLLALLPAAVSLAHTAGVLADRLPGELHGQDFLVTGQVCSFPTQVDGVSRFLFFTNAAHRAPGVPRRLQLASYDRELAPAAGEFWQLKLRLRVPRGSSNPAGYDAGRSAFINGIGGRGYVRESALNRIVQAQASECPTMEIRAGLARGIEQAIPDGRLAGFVIALTVGARHRLTQADWDLLRKTGTVHLMAISGLHIGLVAGLGLAIGRAVCRFLAVPGLHLPRTAVGSTAAVAAAATYAILAGLAVPTLRAFLMVLVAAVAIGFRRRCGGLALLACALFVVLLCQPMAPLSAGFWLSFIAVMLLMLPGLGDRCCAPATSRLRALLGAQLRISAGLAPLGIFLFDQQSLIAPLANLIAIPLLGAVVVPVSLIGTALLVAGAGPMVLNYAATALLVAVTLLEQFSLLPGAHWEPLPRAAWACVLAGAGLMLVSWPRPRPRPWLGVFACLPLLVGAPPETRPAELRVLVLDVGQGLAILIQTRRHNLLYDAGPAWRGGDAGAAVVVPVLRRFGVARLHRILLSHGDRDHAGGLPSVLDRYPTARVTGPPRQLPADIEHEPCIAGQSWTWDGVHFQVLHPPAVARWRARTDNDGSCVLQIRGRKSAVLLTGDIGRAAERMLVARHGQLAANLVVVPHHGSETSSAPALVGATRPRYAVVSAGHRNRWDLPRAAVTARWAASGACVLTTADWGALEFGSKPGAALRLRRLHRATAARLWTYPAPPLTGCAGPGAAL